MSIVHKKCQNLARIENLHNTGDRPPAKRHNQPDFTNIPSLLEMTYTVRGFNVIFLPKFYCELNFIEQCWGYVKRIYRLNPESSRTYLIFFFLPLHVGLLVGEINSYSRRGCKAIAIFRHLDHST